MKSLYFTFLCIIAFQESFAFSAPIYKRMEGWKVEKLGADEVSLTNNIVMYNPNKLGGVRLAKVYFDVFLNDVKIGSVTQTDKVMIRKTSEFSIPLRMTIKPNGGLFDIKSLFGFLTKNATITYDGYIKVVVWIFFPFKAKVKDSITLSMKDLLKLK
jgi:LEA14-like dessication related protein